MPASTAGTAVVALEPSTALVVDTLRITADNFATSFGIATGSCSSACMCITAIVELVVANISIVITIDSIGWCNVEMQLVEKMQQA